MSNDLDEFEKRIDALSDMPEKEWTGESTQISKVPMPFRGGVSILEVLPPKTRVIGLALILASIGGLLLIRGVVQ